MRFRLIAHCAPYQSINKRVMLPRRLLLLHDVFLLLVLLGGSLGAVSVGNASLLPTLRSSNLFGGVGWAGFFRARLNWLRISAKQY